MGFEPTTASLARKYSTTELHPRSLVSFAANYNCQVVEFIFFLILCCAARGHALAIWHRYAAPRSIRPRYARAPLGGQMRSAPRNNKIKFYNKNSPHITNCAKEKLKTNTFFYKTKDRYWTHHWSTGKDNLPCRDILLWPAEQMLLLLFWCGLEGQNRWFACKSRVWK